MKLPASGGLYFRVGASLTVNHVKPLWALLNMEFLMRNAYD